MIERKKKRALATALILSLIMPSSAFPAGAQSMTTVKSPESGTSSFQMSSEEELVHVSNYNWNERTINFDDNWRFFLGEANNAQEIGFDDSTWRQISLPHDYSIEQPYSKTMEAESGYLPGGTGWYRKRFSIPMELANKQIRLDFDGVYMNASVWLNGTQLGTHPYGYTPFSFDLTPYLNYSGDNLLAVKVDHKTPSSRWYSGSGIYRSVHLTVTPMVQVGFDGTTVTTPNLESEDGSSVSVDIKTPVVNNSVSDAQVTLTHSIYRKDDPDKKPIGSFTSESPITIPAGATQQIEDSFSTSGRPTLWSTEDPTLYVVQTDVIDSKGTTDSYVTDFGFRYFNFDVDGGFFLNGDPVKLKGVCMHHDQGSLGSAAYRRAIERQVQMMKEMGANSIRVVHNPAAQILIDICNENGILVVDEVFDGWHQPKNYNNEDYAKWYGKTIESGNQILGKEDGMTWAEFDVKATVRRGINAPSIISWSLGNEVMEGIGGSYNQYPIEAAKLIQWTTEADSTRPVTTGDNKLKNGTSQAISIGNQLTEAGGLVGFNYTVLDRLDEFHRDYPDWKIYGAETASSINSRGVYNTALYDRQFTAYDEAKVGWGHYASQAWYDTIRKDYVAGEYVWTGFDYIGEPTNYNGIQPGPQGAWPSPKNSYFGIVDTAGFPKDSYFLYQSQWNEDTDTVHILPAWNENVVAKDSNGKVKVVVYSDARSVELFFTPSGSNERTSLGKKIFTPKTSEGGRYSYQIYEGDGKDSQDYRNLYLTWMVPYADGTLTAVGYDANGNELQNPSGRSSVTTAGKAAGLSVTADRETIDADGKDLSYITVDVVDGNGTMVPNANNRIRFDIEGDGEIVGVDNGLSVDHDSYQAKSRKAFNGKALVIVRSTKQDGSFTLTASSDNLESNSVTVTTQTPEAPSVGEKAMSSYKISKNYYVKTGNMPSLPESLTINYSDGTTQTQTVTWDTISQEAINQVGSFSLSGKVEGGTVSVNINMLDEIAALLNYSTTVVKGTEPILPVTRPAVGTDGEILQISLPVAWEAFDAGMFEEETTVILHGTSEAFGKELNVTASVRVQDKTYVITDNVAPNATLSETVPANLTSDTLVAIINGSTVSTEAQDSNWRNLSRWSNWNYTMQENNEPPSSIIFTYATQEMLGQAKVYFVDNTIDLRYPDAEGTKWHVSNDGPDGPWTTLVTEEVIDAEASGRVKCYTYNFTPTMATYLKLELNNTQNPNPPVGAGKKPTTAITEVELLRTEGSFTTNNSTNISKLVLNGIEVPSSALTGSEYKTPMGIVESLEMSSDVNAAMTALPEADGIIRILTESEDHMNRSSFLIHLGSEAADDPADDSKDYPAIDTTVTVGSEQAPAEKKEFVLDGDISTIWHTAWANATPLEDRWITLNLKEPTSLDAVRYYSRNGEANGRVNNYKVEVSMEGTDWETVSTGSWGNTAGWKIAKFKYPVTAAYVRLTGVTTYGNTANEFMSAAELRVRTAPETISIASPSNAVVTLDQDIYELPEDQSPVKPVVTVTYDGTELKYGIDYNVSYENNTKPGTASVTVKGIMKYSGEIKKDFRIISKNSQTITVVNGTVTEIEGIPDSGGSTAVAEGGSKVTVKADTPAEGMVFSHWRTAPSGLGETIDAKKSSLTFELPDSTSLLTAVYRAADTPVLQKEAFSENIPSDMFAYADSDSLDSILDSILTMNDQVTLERGGSIQMIMNLRYAKTEPAAESFYRTATPSNAETASPSNAEKPDKASPSNASRPSGIRTKEVLEEAGYSNTKERQAVKVGFWLRSTLTKRVKSPTGQVTETPVSQTPDGDVPTTLVTVELPKDCRNMANYQVMQYQREDGETFISEVPSTVEGNLISFDASIDGVYAVMYTKSFEVQFLDWDGTLIDKQYVSYGDDATEPEHPTREGYLFTGWSREFEDVTKNLTIRAEYEKLQEEAKKDKLEALIQDIQDKLYELDQEIYTESSFRLLEAALEDAIAVLEDSAARQAEVDRAMKKLNTAFQNLRIQYHTVVFRDWNNTLLSQQKVVHGKAAIAPKAPTRSGYRFKEWSEPFNDVTSALQITALYEKRSSNGGSGGSSDSSKPAQSDAFTAIPGYTKAGTWKANGTEWKYLYTDGTPATDTWLYLNWQNRGTWFRMDPNGNMATGWFNDVDGSTYYLHDSADGTRGRMYTGWNWITGEDGQKRCYYFNETSDGTKGKLFKNGRTPDGHQVNEAGEWTVNNAVQTRK